MVDYFFESLKLKIIIRIGKILKKKDRRKVKNK